MTSILSHLSEFVLNNFAPLNLNYDSEDPGAKEVTLLLSLQESGCRHTVEIVHWNRKKKILPGTL